MDPDSSLFFQRLSTFVKDRCTCKKYLWPELGIDNLSWVRQSIVGFLSPIIILFFISFYHPPCVLYFLYLSCVFSFFNVFTVQTSFLFSILRSFVASLSTMILSVPRIILLVFFHPILISPSSFPLYAFFTPSFFF